MQHSLPTPISDQERGKDRPGKQVCKFLPLGGNDLAWCQLAGDQLQRKDLGVLADNKLEKSQQYALCSREGQPYIGLGLQIQGSNYSPVFRACESEPCILGSHKPVTDIVEPSLLYHDG